MDDDKDSLAIKIIDWGCAQTIKTSVKSKNADGTAYYIAPEVLRGEYNENVIYGRVGLYFIYYYADMPHSMEKKTKKYMKKY